jgi:hypothetical protein
VTLSIEHPRPWRWEVKKGDDVVGVVVGKSDIGFFVIDHEANFIGSYCSLTKALFAVTLSTRCPPSKPSGV